ncbi:MAG: branched-chain amino acid ABC transporter permease, partial [Deltaproteobacteria bacterium]|nr:branched-chain amino acid ABC transporter permease [Deltaproteobacteria bacterium]
LTYLFKIKFGFPFWFAIPIFLFLCATLGCLIDFFVYRPLRRKESSSLVFLLASLGSYIVLQNLISLAFGDDNKTF